MDGDTMATSIPTDGMATPIPRDGMATPIPTNGMATPIPTNGMATPIPRDGMATPIPTDGCSYSEEVPLDRHGEEPEARPRVQPRVPVRERSESVDEVPVLSKVSAVL